jgi:hypothetical protein
LYGGQEVFLNEANDLASGVIEDLLGELKLLEEQQQFATQAVLSLRLLDVITLYSDLGEPSLLRLSVNLWHLAQRHSDAIDRKALVSKNTQLITLYKINYSVLIYIFRSSNGWTCTNSEAV